MEVGSAYSTVSLSSGPSGEEELDPLETIGTEDEGFERSEDRAALEPALERLPAREREILRMRFEEGLPQTQIAQRVGLSQMHVSRLIRKSLAVMREELAPNAARRGLNLVKRTFWFRGTRPNYSSQRVSSAARWAVLPAETIAGGIEWGSSVDARWCCSSRACPCSS